MKNQNILIPVPHRKDTDMCGIIGYTGQKNALPILIEGLRSLEYRGYDSAGIAFFKDSAPISIKSKGRIDELASKIDPALSSDCGIGHTRWATHGAPSDVNSHPHGTDRLYIVHNGIIENYAELKTELEKEGYSFQSETDTEVAAKLIDLYFGQTGDPVLSLKKASLRFRGSFAIAAIFEGFSSLIYGIRRDNPMLIALSDEGNFIASDISAVLKFTDRYLSVNEGETAVVGRDFVKILDSSQNELERDEEKALWSRDAAEKGGFDHFMLKEIHEEPEAVIKTLRPRIRESLPFFESPLLSKERLESYGHIHIIACGTAYHAGLIARVAIERLCRKRVTVELASEFRYSGPILSENDLVIVISQSGETADTLAALRLSKEMGAATLGIVNVAGSSVAREADDSVYTLCGPEIAVASTKAFTVQIALLYLIALHIAYAEKKLSEEETKKYTDELLNSIPLLIKKVVDTSDTLRELAERFNSFHSIFFIGRGIDYALCNEAALKCKEISYIHCEAYAAGELKHGTISLIESGTPVICLMTEPSLTDKMISNIREVKSRGADLLLITSEGMRYPSDIADSVLTLPRTTPLFSPLVSATAVQLLAYFLSFSLGIDVDKPRNLAKSVTVE